MNNTAMSIDKAKNCMPYIQSMRLLVMIERITKNSKRQNRSNANRNKRE